MGEYKSVGNYLKRVGKQKGNDKNTFLFSIINKILICALMFMGVLCITKIYPDTKDVIHKYVYQDNIAFSKMSALYQKYLGSLFPLDGLNNDLAQAVFNETLEYKEATKYNEGVKLTVEDNYLMPVIESGIVVFIGNKDNYGKTIIVQQVNGIDLWYVNIKGDSVKLYDYVEKGSLLGEALDDEVYLYYQKSGEFLDYKEYLK